MKSNCINTNTNTNHDVVHILYPRCSLLGRYPTISRYIRNFNLIYTHKKIVAFPVTVFTKQHFMQIFYTEFRSIRTVNV